MIKEGFGTDIGRVLAEHATMELLGQPGRHLAVPEIDGSFDALGLIRRERFPDSTFVISMCDEQTEVRSKEWLAHREFTARTGVAWDHIIYCRTFAEKALIAARLGLTVFVDDRSEVLSHFNNGEKLFLFRPDEQECAPFSQHLKKMTKVQNWQQIVASTISLS